ncbi:hypothetical protein QL285_007136 [Trifolium repens]|nr:hypothetical protein QL285_007136 [Trifolium repens]
MASSTSSDDTDPEYREYLANHHVDEDDPIPYWEYQIGEKLSNYLDIPEMYGSLFVDPNQNEIILFDSENNQNYSCKLHISKTNPNKIHIGKGWRKYVTDNNLKPYDQLMFVLSKPPTSVQGFKLLHQFLSNITHILFDIIHSMAASSSKCQSSGSDTLDDNSFTTTIDPEKEKIWVCPDFLKRWGHKLNFKKHGYIVNGETDQKTLIRFKNDNGEVFISCGMSLAIMNRITKPTKFELQYECYENNFLMYPINGDNEGSTESDHHADQLLQEICDFAREYEKQQVQEPVFGEPEVGHYTWKQTCSRAFARGHSCLHFPREVCNNLPFGHNQILEVVNGETNYTEFCPVKKSDTSNPQYHLTKPWEADSKSNNMRNKLLLMRIIDKLPYV